MRTAKEAKDPEDVGKHQRAALHAVIAEQVLHILGRPTDFLEVRVRPLWDLHYRVNVFVGESVASARVGNSYFLVADGDGNVTDTTPLLRKMY